MQVRFDPFSDMKTVWIYSHDEQYLGQGALYNRDKGAKTAEYCQKGKPQNNYIELLVQEHEKKLQAKNQAIDYRKTLSNRQWPFTAFVQTVARLMGQEISAFNSEEYEILKKTYNRLPLLNEIQVVQAWQKAPIKTIAHLICQLQNIK